MIADCDSNVVLIADCLERRFPDVHRALKSMLSVHGIPLKTLPGALDIWCRDYMPVQVGEDRFVQFRYAPNYLMGKHRHLRTDGEIGPTLPWLEGCERSEIVLDGGNVVGWTDKVIVCDKLFAENPDWKPSELLRRLGKLLEVERVIVIPTEPGDVVGHADGVIRFIDGDVVLANDYSTVDSCYGRTLRRVLVKAGLEVVQLPYRPRTGRFRGIPPAFGCYINYLRVGRVILLPGYGLPEDEEVQNRVQGAFPDSLIRTLNCSGLSEEGGVLSCVTWNLLDADWKQS